MRAGGVAPESRPPSRLLQALQLLTPFACPWYFGALHAQRDFGDDAAFSQEAVSARFRVACRRRRARSRPPLSLPFPGNGGSASYLPPGISR